MKNITNMKVLALTLVAFVASASALPHMPVEEAIRTGQTKLVTNQIEQAIKDVSQAIVDAGLDPFIIDHQSSEYALPVPSIFNYRSHVTGLLFKGASDISINSLSMGLVTLRLVFDISLPEISMHVVDSEVNAHLFGKNINGHLSGTLVVNDVRVIGNMRFSVGILTGTNLSSIDIGFKLGGIHSNLKVGVLGVDCSNAVNIHLGKTIAETFKTFESEINEMITMVAKDYIESML